MPRVDSGYQVGLAPSAPHEKELAGGFKNARSGGVELFMAALTGPWLVLAQSPAVARPSNRCVADVTSRWKATGSGPPAEFWAGVAISVQAKRF